MGTTTSEQSSTTTTEGSTTTPQATTSTSTTSATTTEGPVTTSTSTTTAVATTTVFDNSTTTTTTTEEPATTTSSTNTTTTTEGPTTTATTTTTEATWETPSIGEPVVNQQHRCGTSEIDAREHCRSTCGHSGDCADGMFCWGVHPNYCGSIPQRVFTNPVQSKIWTRCGKKEIDARTFCGAPCTWSGQCSDSDSCIGLNSNYCDSPYTEV